MDIGRIAARLSTVAAGTDAIQSNTTPDAPLESALAASMLDAALNMTLADLLEAYGVDTGQSIHSSAGLHKHSVVQLIPVVLGSVLTGSQSDAVAQLLQKSFLSHL